MRNNNGLFIQRCFINCSQRFTNHYTKSRENELDDFLLTKSMLLSQNLFTVNALEKTNYISLASEQF